MLKLTIAEPGPTPAEITCNGVRFVPVEAAPDPASNARTVRHALRALSREPGCAVFAAVAESATNDALNRLRRLLR